MLTAAAEVLDEISERFVAGIRAPSVVEKGPDDFATAVDLELERRIADDLLRRTGIPVHGEEFGGPALDRGTAWVLDPIDGTFNYSAGHPLAGVLLALLRDGEPVLGLTWLPLLGSRYAALASGPLLVNGKPQPPLSEGALNRSMIGFGNFDVTADGRIPGRFRFDVLGALSRLSSRVRMHGSTGVDLAFTAGGTLGGAIVFGHHPWDNAAGVALVRAAGGVVTDVAGQPWSLESESVLAAAPGVHGELVAMIAAARQDPSTCGGSRR